MITIALENARPVAERYAIASREIETYAKAGMDDMGQFTLKLLQRKVNVKTGKLRDSMKYKLTKEGHGYKVTFSADAISDHETGGTEPYYVNFVDQGTPPHTIRVRNARALHFFDKSGNEVFAQAVYHPGYKGSHFSTKAAIEARKHADIVLKKIARDVARAVTA